MKTKEEILKMSRSELYSLKWSKEIEETFSDCSSCSYCSSCSDCSYCSYCSYCSSCSDCSYCRQGKKLKYAICNVEFTKEEYEKKMKELKNEK